MIPLSPRRRKKRNTVKPLLLASAVLLSLTSAAQAWAAKSAAEVKTGQVVVSATRMETELKDAPNSISVVTQEDIEREPAPTVADLLKDIPGVQVLDQSIAGVKRVTIRGESPSRVLIMVDGQKVPEQKSMDGSMILVDLNDVERIEVIKGPASVLHGSEAIGGVVNIITKKGGKKPIQLAMAETFDGSANALTEYLSAFGGIDGWSYRVSGSYTDGGNRYAPGGPVDDSGYLSRNFSAYVDKVLARPSSACAPTASGATSRFRRPCPAQRWWSSIFRPGPGTRAPASWNSRTSATP
jgi:hemoglobin/transferrin/lactoferrin receptor protein